MRLCVEVTQGEPLAVVGKIKRGLVGGDTAGWMPGPKHQPYSLLPVHMASFLWIPRAFLPVRMHFIVKMCPYWKGSPNTYEPLKWDNADF